MNADVRPQRRFHQYADALRRGVSSRRRLVAEGIWIAGGQVASAIGTLIGIRLLTEVVPPAVFGSANLLVAIAALALALVSSPLFQAALRFYPEAIKDGNESQLRAAVRPYLQRGVLLVAAAMVVGGTLASHRTGLAIWVGLLLGATVLIETKRNQELTFLTAARNQKLYSIWNAVDTCLRPLGAVGAVLFFGPSAEAVLIGYAITSAAVLLLFQQRQGARHAALGRPDPELKGRLRRFAIPLIPLALVGWISATSDRYIIGGVLGVREVGIYAAAYGLVMRPFTIVSTTVITTFRPLLFQSVTLGQHAHAKQTISLWLASVAAICVGGVGLFAFFRHEVVSLLLAEQYRGSAQLIPWFAVGFAFLCFSQAHNTIAMAYNSSGTMSISEGIGAAASIAVTIPLVISRGLMGAAIAVPIYYGIQWLAALLLGLRAHRRFMLAEERRGLATA